MPKISKVAPLIDHTLLHPTSRIKEVIKLCQEAAEYGFYSVCVLPSFVSQARQELASTHVKVCTVIGFPLGAQTTAAKVFEAQDAIQNGAQELDMVIHIGRLLDGNDAYVREDIRQVKEACPPHVLLKVILETALLNEQQIISACQMASQAGADFVKTSTGFNGPGATEQAVRLMRASIDPGMEVKASGGIRSLQNAQAMIQAGASRIGASASVAIALEENLPASLSSTSNLGGKHE